MTDLTIKVDAHRKAINALGVQTAERFDRLERRMDGFDQRMDRLESTVDEGFAEMRAKFDQTATGMQLIVDLLTPGPSEA